MKKFTLAVIVIIFSGQLLIAQAPIAVSLTTTNSNCSNPCSGSISTHLSNGSGYYKYHWSNGDSTSTITNLCAGTYNLTVTDSLRCVQSHGVNCTTSASTNIYAGAFSSTSANFNNTAIVGGDYIWFTSAFQVHGQGSTPVTISFTGQTISCGSFSVNVPDAEITINPSAHSASTSYNGAQWVSTFPAQGGGNLFLSAAEYLVPHAGLPANLSGVTWKGYMSASQAGVQVQWQWGAAVYTSFSANMSTVGVKPVDDPHMSTYQNGDHAGTPENYKQFMVQGATGNAPPPPHNGPNGPSVNGPNNGPNVNVTPCVYPIPGVFGACGYPDSSNLPRSADVFNESTVLVAADLGSSCNIFRAWYNDETTLTLGIRQVITKTHSHSDTVNYPVSIYPGSPGCVTNPQVGSTIQTGAQSGNDQGAGGGQPMWPALFITDITSDAGNRSGDWQQGGTGYAPTKVCGTWKAAVKTVDSTTNPVTVTITPGENTAKNNWNIGNSDTPSVGFSALDNEGYGTEIQWDLNALGLNIIPGHLYRVELMVHDGDQNHTGGDVGEMCIEETFSPGVTATGGNLGCGIDSVQLTAVSTATGAVYHWSGPNGFTSTQQNPFVHVSGSYSVSVTNLGINRCSGDSTGIAVAVALVTQTSPVVSGSVIFNVSCHGLSNGRASVSVSGGTLPYSYAWSNGASTDSITGLVAGTYKVTVTDQSGCSISDSFSISQPQFALQIIDSSELDASCYGYADGIAEMVNCATGGTPPYSYLWSNGDTTLYAEDLKAGHYSVTVSDAHNCTGTASVTIRQPDSLTASIVGTNPCYPSANGTANVLITGGSGFNQYVWSNGETASPATGLAAGPYTVTVTDQNECTATASVTLSQPPALAIIDSSETDVSCYGGDNGQAELINSVIGGTPPYSYLWSNGNATIETNGLQAGPYSVTVHDANNCTATASVTVHQPPLLTATITTTGVSCDTCSNGTAEATASGGSYGDTYIWNTGATVDSISGLPAGNYSVTVTDGNGCKAFASGTVPSHKEAVATDPNDCSLNPAQCAGSGLELSLYPNPFTNQFHLSLKNVGITPVSMKIYDLLGNVVMGSAGIPPENDITLASYAKGIYLLEIDQGDLKRVVRMIKQ